MFKVFSSNNQIMTVFIEKNGEQVAHTLAPKASIESDAITPQMVNLQNLKLITVKEIKVAPNSVATGYNQPAETSASSSSRGRGKKGGSK